MRHLCLAMISALLLCVQTVPAADDKADDKDELAKMKGSWTVEKVISRGREIPADDTKGAKVTIDGGKLTIELSKEGATKKLVVGLKLDPSKSPKEVDMTIEEGGSRPGEKGLGIYVHDGDLLKFCHGERDSDPRPTDFKSEAGSTATLMVLKRVK